MVRSDLRDLVADLLELQRERVDALADLLEILGRELALAAKRLKLLKGNRLAVYDRQDVGLHTAGHRARDQRETVGTKLLLEGCAELSHRLLSYFVERGTLGAHGVRIEGLGQLLFDELDQSIDAAAEFASATARNGN